MENENLKTETGEKIFVDFKKAIKIAFKGKKEGQWYFKPSNDKMIVLDRGYEGDELEEGALYEGTLKDFEKFVTFRPKFKVTVTDSYNKISENLDNLEADSKDMQTFFDTIFIGINKEHIKYDLISELRFRIEESYKMHTSMMKGLRNNIRHMANIKDNKEAE